MKHIFLTCAVAAFVTQASASWYWPFGDDDEADEEEEVSEDEPRLSDLVEPASLLIDEASDLASDGKSQEALEKYREAIKELDKIEAENPKRAKRPEFATIRTKKAYVNAAIDTLLLKQARSNAKIVAVSDTLALEERWEAEKKVKEEAKKNQATGKKTEKKKGEKKKEEKKKAEEESDKDEDKEDEEKEDEEEKKPSKPKTETEQVMQYIGEKNFGAADAIIKRMLDVRPNDAKALNLKAAREAAAGLPREAEHTLDQAIQSHPRDYHAYYNMADLFLQSEPPNRDGARRYYETGRTLGGPVDKALEEAFK